MRGLKIASVLFAYACVALAEPAFEVVRVEKGSKSPFPVTQKNAWKWYLNSEKVKTLWLSVELSSDEFTKYIKAKVGPGTRVQLKGNALTLLMNRVAQGVLLNTEGGEKLALRLDFVTPVSTIFDDNCKKERVVLASKASFPFYLGTTCKIKDGNLSFSLTFPNDVELIDSTLLESKGKGESWRHYEMGKVRIAGESIGRFKFSHKGKSYDFSLETIPLEGEAPAPPKEDRIAIAGGVGYSFLGLSSASGATASDAKPAIVLRVPHYPVYKGLGVGANLDFALPISSSTDGIGYIQLEGVVSYEFVFGKSFRVRPKVEYLFSSTTQESTSIGLTVNQIGFGASVEYRISDIFFVTLDGMTAGIRGGALQSHLVADLSVIRKKPGELGYGIGFRYQSYGATGSLGILRTFSHNTVYLLLAF